jgi:hypothetical protein
MHTVYGISLLDAFFVYVYKIHVHLYRSFCKKLKSDKLKLSKFYRPVGIADLHTPILFNLFSLEVNMRVHLNRRKIRLIEGKAKCRHLKKGTRNGTLRQVSICLRPRTPYLSPLYTLYVYVYEYSILIHTGKKGRVEPERRGKRQQFTTLGRKYQHD